MDYGTLPESPEKTSNDLVRVRLNEYGGPKILFMQTWVGLLPILLPLHYIQYMNSSQHQYATICQALPAWSFERVMCDISSPPVFVFAPICKILALFLLTWRFARQRLWYVLLQRKVLVDFHRTPVPKVVLKVMAVLLSLCILNWWVAMNYGHERDANNVVTSKTLREVSLKEIFWDVNVLKDPKNRAFYDYLSKVFWNFVIPAGIAFYFVYRNTSAQDVMNTLIPLGKLHKADSWYIQQHFKDTLAMKEPIAREILDTGEDGTQRGGGSLARTVTELNMDRDINAAPNLSEAVEIFREEALTFAGCSVIGCYSDPESVQSDRKTAPPIPDDLYYAIFQSWWPLNLILKDEKTVDDMQFRWAWLLHCLLCFIISGEAIVSRFYGMNNVWNGMGQLGHWAGLSSGIIYFMLNIPVVAVMFFANFCIVVHVYHHVS